MIPQPQPVHPAAMPLPPPSVTHASITTGLAAIPYATYVATRLIQPHADFARNIIISSRKTRKSVAPVKVLQIPAIVKLYAPSRIITMSNQSVKNAPAI